MSDPVFQYSITGPRVNVSGVTESRAASLSAACHVAGEHGLGTRLQRARMAFSLRNHGYTYDLGAHTVDLGMRTDGVLYYGLVRVRRGGRTEVVFEEKNMPYFTDAGRALVDAVYPLWDVPHDKAKRVFRHSRAGSVGLSRVEGSVSRRGVEVLMIAHMDKWQ